MPPQPSQPPFAPLPGGGPTAPSAAGTEPDAPGAPPARPSLAATAAETTADNPWPLRLLSRKITDYVARMSHLWVEGQMVQLNRRPGAGMAFMTLRDTEQDFSMNVSVLERVLNAVTVDLQPGARIVVRCKPTFWSKRGTLQLEAAEIRAVGIGELLAQIEQLKRQLAAEGLFAPERKRPLPFLPQLIGLVCGRESAAEKDVVVNAQARWPGVRFEIRNVAVQGSRAPAEVASAIAELDAHPEVDLIVVSRGGGSLEDLLAFSSEQICRAAAACATPLVSAIGHEVDSPLLDLVADLRASTPTDAAKRIVPDIAVEISSVHSARDRMLGGLQRRLQQERQWLQQLRTRPVMSDPSSMFARHRDDVERLRRQSATLLQARVNREAETLSRLVGAVTALSPKATLERGYAIVHRDDGHVIRSAVELKAGENIRIRFAEDTGSALVVPQGAGLTVASQARKKTTKMKPLAADQVEALKAQDAERRAAAEAELEAQKIPERDITKDDE